MAAPAPPAVGSAVAADVPPPPAVGGPPRWARWAGVAVAAGLAAAAVGLAWGPVASAVALERGRAALARHDPEAAADLLAAAAADSPRDGALAFEAVRAKRRAGDYADDPAALEAALTRAARLGADPEAVRRERVLAAAAAGRLDGPKGVWKELSGLLRDDRGDLAGICTAYVNGLCVNRRFAEAGRLLDEWEAVAPGDAELLYRRGLIALSQQADEEAEDAFRAALAAAPWRADAAVKLVEALRLRDEVGGSEAGLLEPFTRSRPDDPAVWASYAEALAAADRPAEAVPAFRRAIELNPLDLDLRQPLAEALLAAGDPAGALEAVGPLLAAWPEDRRGNLANARALRELGRTREAAAAFAKVGEVERTRGPLLELIRRVNEGGTADADALSRIGRLQLAHEDRGEGLAYLTAAVRADPRHGPSHAALARALEVGGRPDLARRHRRLAARYGAGPPGADGKTGNDDGGRRSGGGGGGGAAG